MKAFLRWLWVRLSFNFVSEYKKSIKFIREGQNIETNSTCHGMHNSLGVKRLNNVKGSHSLCNAKVGTKRHVIWYQNLDLLLVHEDGNGGKKIQSLQNARPRQRYKLTRCLLRAELCYPYCIDLTEVVSTFDKVDIGVTRLCRIKIYEDWFKLRFMLGIWR